MLPPSVLAQLDGLRTAAARDEPCRGDREWTIPVERYFAHDVWQREVAGLFRPLPLIAAHASELAPGQALAHDAYGVPLLLTRDAEGRARAFLNVCRHRGMRLVDGDAPVTTTGVACPYHGWTYRLDGALRHRLHADAFDPCPPEDLNLVPVPCEERHGLLWVVPDPRGTMDLAAWLGGLDAELPAWDIPGLRLHRVLHAEHEANWKLIVDAFLESYHIRVLHKDTIWPFFADGISNALRYGPHIASLVGRREAVPWAREGGAVPESQHALRKLVTPTQVIFPNTIAIHHPDYLSLITLYAVGPERLRWTHRMLVPAAKTTPDWAPHWDKTYALIDQGVFRREDIHCAVQIQRGLKSGANRVLRAGRLEQALGWFHGSVAEYAGHPG